MGSLFREGWYCSHNTVKTVNLPLKKQKEETFERLYFIILNLPFQTQTVHWFLAIYFCQALEVQAQQQFVLDVQHKEWVGFILSAVQNSW